MINWNVLFYISNHSSGHLFSDKTAFHFSDVLRDYLQKLHRHFSLRKVSL
ncbi:hypothetical protein HMPREF0880_01074 [Yokenella regensburgei ATCC 43003]|nr:hypothetical protein HMPREF0880_01074 [Yokenella regensburgei ATCC 43003]